MDNARDDPGKDGRLQTGLNIQGSDALSVLVWPTGALPFEVRFETPPGRQAQVDFAHFRTVFTDEPGAEHVIWLFSLVWRRT